MAMSFLYNFSIDITSGTYYDRTSNCLLVPWNTNAYSALQGCKISGRLSLYDNSWGQDLIEEDTIDQTIDLNSHTSDNGYFRLTITNVAWSNGNFAAGKNYFKLSFTAVYVRDGQSYPISDYTSYKYGGGGNEYAKEATPTSIVITDTKKNVIYGYQNSLSGSITMSYSDGTDVSLSGANMQSYLTQNNTKVIYGGVTRVFPNNFNCSEEALLTDNEINIRYELDNGGYFTQKLLNRYDKEFRLSYSTTETGSQAEPLHITGSTITIAKTQFAAVVTHHNNMYVDGVKTSSTQEENVSSSVVWNPGDTFTREQVLAMNGNPYNIQIVYTNTSFNDQTSSALMTVYIETKNVRSLVINGITVTPVYYNKENSYFINPTFTLKPGKSHLYTFIYNDGSREDFDDEDLTNKKYFISKKTQEALVSYDGTNPTEASIITPNITRLCVEVTYNGFTASEYFPIPRVDDSVSSLTTSSTFNFVKGNRWNKYKGTSLIVTATYQNPAREADTNFVGYSFVNNGIIMSGTNGQQSLSVTVGSNNFTLTPTVTFLNPDISSVDIIDSTGIKPSYQNSLDSIDLTHVKLLAHYEDAEYTQQLTFDTTSASSATSKFTATVYNTETEATIPDVSLDGTVELQLSNTEPVYYCSFEMAIQNAFSSTTEVELHVPFLAITLTQFTGLKVINAYRDYKVGEKFLKEEDNTQVVLFYNDGNTEKQKIVYLKDDLPTLSVNYPAGTEWTNPDSSKRIVVSSVFDASINSEYTIQVLYDGYVSGSETTTYVVVWQEEIECPDGTRVSEKNGVLGIYKESDTTVTNGIRTANNGAVLHGYIKNIFDTKLLEAQATMVLFDDPTPPIEGSPNITITYPSWSGLVDNINKCQFGILFGNNNANNRLFISGNPDVRNADWHSAETNTIHTEGEAQNINGDFSYFPAENVMYYGETDNKVIGYDIVSNDKLLVIKDKSDKEKTIYFRTPTMVTALDATGTAMTDVQGNTLYQEEFALVKGNNSVAGINPHAILNLNGDTLFIDADNTVQGLDLTGIVGDNQRYANSRSKYIDNYLKDLDLSKSFLWTNNKYLFFPIKDVGIFATHINTKGSGTNQYEWWLLQGENPTCFVEIDNVVYYGTGDGELFRMRNGKYQDEYKVFVSEGNGIITIDEDGEKIVVSNDVFSLLHTDRELFYHANSITNDYKGSLFQQVGYISNDETEEGVDLLIKQDEDENYYLYVVGNNDIERQRDLIKLMKENKTYYLNYVRLPASVQEIKCAVGSPFHDYGNKYRLVYVPGGEYDRYLMEIYNELAEEWQNISLENLYKANLVQMLDGEYRLINIDEDNNSFQLQDEAGDLMNIVYYGDQPFPSISFYGEIIERRNVSAYYISAPFSMGSLNYFKTIWQITLTNDTGEPSEYDLAIASNKIPTFDTKTIASISKAMIGTNFGDFMFSAVDFDKDVVPRTYTVQRTMGRQKFLCFAFKNDNNSNAILSSLSVIYTIPFPSYGND